MGAPAWDPARLLLSLRSLATERPVFHSEADFQHSLAWAMRMQHPRGRARLEVPMRGGGEIDVLWLEPDGARVGIELKYARGVFDHEVAGERFFLKGTDPKDVARYAFWNDVRRLEQWVESGEMSQGFAVLLSNDPTCWNQPPRPGANDERFRFHEGASIAGTLDWVRPPKQINPGKPIPLRGAYACTWAEYSKVDGPTRGVFRTLIAAVEPPNPHMGT